MRELEPNELSKGSWMLPRFTWALLFTFALAWLDGDSVNAMATVVTQEDRSAVADAAALATPELDAESMKLARSWVRRLSDSDYAVRQRATRSLWQLGPSVLPLLEKAVEAGRGESRMRAAELTTLIRIGLKPDADAAVVDIIAGFFDFEKSVQQRIVKKLCYLNQRNVALKLIELVDSKSDRAELFDACFGTVSEAENALRVGDLEAFEAWIRDPAINQHNELLYYYYLWIDDRLDEEIERLKPLAEAEIEALKKFTAQREADKLKKAKRKKSSKQSASELEPEPTAPDEKSLKKLIALLRFMQRPDEALLYTNRLFDRGTRRLLTHTILMESGNWKKLASLIVDSKIPAADVDAELPADDDSDSEKQVQQPEDLKDGLAFVVEGYRRAVVQFYAGLDDEMQQTLEVMERDFAKLGPQRKGQPVRFATNANHSSFLEYTLQFDRSLKFRRMKRDSATFDRLVANNRYEEVFKLFGLETFDSREKYFKNRIRNIRSLCQMADRVRVENSDRAEELDGQRNEAILMYWKVVSLLASLGFDAEAELFYRQLYFEISDDAPHVASATIQSLRNICAYEAAWEIAELEMKRSRRQSLLSGLLSVDGYEHEVANFLDAQLVRKYSEPIERYRKIASLVQSPMDLSGNSVDLWQTLQDINVNADPAAMDGLFAIWDVDKEMYFDQKVTLDSRAVANEALASGDFLLAAQKFESLALREGYAASFAQAWFAYRQANSPRKAKLMRLLFALKFDPEEAYEYPETFNGTHWQSLPFDAFRLHDCLTETTIDENCYYAWRMVNDDAEGVIDPRQAMIRSQLLRYNYIESPYMEGSENDHPRFVRGALASGDSAAALRWLNKLSDFRPADSGLVESVFKNLELAGESDFAAKMLQRVSQDFYSILQRYPESSLHLNNYAWVCACSGQNVENAISMAQRATALRDGRAGYWDTLAELYFVAGRHDEAIETIRRAIKINPMREYYREQLLNFRKAKKAGLSESNGLQ